jgi:hypothetical protein
MKSIGIFFFAAPAKIQEVCETRIRAYTYKTPALPVVYGKMHLTTDSIFQG